MKVSALLVAVMLVAGTATAQTLTANPGDASSQPAVSGGLAVPAEPSSIPASIVSATPPSSGVSLSNFGTDLRRFFSLDEAKILAPFMLGGLAATHWDSATVEDARERVSPSTAGVGNLAGSFYTQAGAAVGTYLVGRATNRPQVAQLGGDLIRAQLLSQVVVQGTKFVVGRQRPDGSNSVSFPSGHTASAFATATVLQQHFSWKAGIPAYAFAGFVGASRMASGKHYLSDVLVGAGIGIAAGHTVTLHLAGEKFAVGAAPTQGGAMVTFTRR